jgi:hypothetical protein
MAGIVERVKHKLSVMPYVEERKLLHGIGFLLRGSFFLGIWKDSLMVKLSQSEVREILSMPFVTLFNEIEKVYIPDVALVGPQGVERDEQLDYWITRAALHVESKGSRGEAHRGQTPTIFDRASLQAGYGDNPMETLLLETDRATAKLLRLRKGQTFEFQARSQPAMFFVADGEAAFQGVDGQQPAKSGIWCFVPPYCRVVVHADSVTAVIVVVL